MLYLMRVGFLSFCVRVIQIFQPPRGAVGVSRFMSAALFLCLFLGSYGFYGQNEARAAQIELYNYHNSPPFVTGPSSGLTHDLVAYLNRQGQGRFIFNLTHLPRKRLDRLLSTNQEAVVLWVAPDWFDENLDNRFDWTRPIMIDGNVFLSSTKNPIEVETIYSLKHLLLGGILGYRYDDLDRQVRNGFLRRTNAMDERALIRLVAHGRIDVGIMAQSTARYLVRENGVENLVYFGAKNHSIYARRLLLSGHPPRVQRFLDKVIGQMGQDPEWIAVMGRYNLQPSFFCLPVQGCQNVNVEDKLLLETEISIQEAKS